MPFFMPKTNVCFNASIIHPRKNYSSLIVKKECSPHEHLQCVKPVQISNTSENTMNISKETKDQCCTAKMLDTSQDNNKIVVCE